MEELIRNHFLKLQSLDDMSFDLTTLQLGKERSASKYRVIAFKLIDTTGQKWSWFCILAQNQAKEWQVQGITGGPENLNPHIAKPDNLPVLNFVPWREPDYFFGLGTIKNYEKVITIVRLRWKPGRHLIVNENDLSDIKFVPHNGSVLEDTIEDDTVIFLVEEQLNWPDLVEYCDNSGEIIATQPWFGGIQSGSP